MKSKNFPENLLDANRYLTQSNKIKTLYYRGNFDSSIFDKCVAVVGSRRATSYGEGVCRKLAYDIASCGLTVVSGFAYGIDSYAHESSLDAGGKTVAVLGYGIRSNLENSKKQLFNRILDSGGLILSEYANKESAQRWTFAKRNRIVAGLSSAVLIVEAEEKSGSLITANYALKMKRRVFAVPGSYFSKNSVGTAGLIKGEGEIFTNIKEIFAIFDQNSSGNCWSEKEDRDRKLRGKDTRNHKKGLKLAPETCEISENIKNLLKTNSYTAEELIAELDIDFMKLSEKLFYMQLLGEIYKIDSRFYINPSFHPLSKGANRAFE